MQPGAERLDLAPHPQPLSIPVHSCLLARASITQDSGATSVSKPPQAKSDFWPRCPLSPASRSANLEAVCRNHLETPRAKRALPLPGAKGFLEQLPWGLSPLLPWLLQGHPVEPCLMPCPAQGRPQGRWAEP